MLQPVTDLLTFHIRTWSLEPLKPVVPGAVVNPYQRSTATVFQCLSERKQRILTQTAGEISTYNTLIVSQPTADNR